MRAEDFKKKIFKTRLFLFDLDGTMYRGNELIPGAKRLIDHLRARNIQYVFLTNNSSKSAADYVRKLTALDLPATYDTVFTAGQATAIHISQKKPHASIFLVGTESFKHELLSFGLELNDGSTAPDFVVVGFDTELTYAKIRTACELIDSNVEYVATNPDFVCPVQGGKSIPDCGSICCMIEQATGKRPFAIGKPRPEMIKLVQKRYGYKSEEVVMIGDRLYTDIAMGRKSGVFTVCVLSGESTREDIKKSLVKPDYVIESVEDIADIFDRDSQ